ncbi:organic solute transporter subunit alpha [Orussus abietinus]|uniref:organic solute transporter subunit alpha n=1 Tax=Orussus abietinus TaxID=222816 RepID=UPI0006259535|nr:organic solute transporter subunit alpha [Orussus abietinus]
MDRPYPNPIEDLRESDFYHENVSCDHGLVPTAIENIESLAAFGAIILSIGSLLWIVTLYLAIDAAYNVLLQEETSRYKTSAVTILSVYPVASLCSLLAIAVPRVQVASEATTQIFLTISFYRLYLLLIDVGRKTVSKPPPLKLNVGPCCCWPCLPFPTADMNGTYLSWLGISVVQLPIVQGLTYCIFLFMAAEEPSLVRRYGVFFQPLSVSSILLGIYGVTVTTKSLHDVAPEAGLQLKTLVSQLVLLFSKLQGFIIKSLSGTGLFPCNPPLTPLIYSYVTYNALMVIEMLLLCYAARLLYTDSEKREDSTRARDQTKDKETSGEVMNNNEERTV